jgi:hypothetical protein
MDEAQPSAGGQSQDFLTWSMNGGVEDSALEVRQTAGVFPPEKYAEYYDESQDLLDRLNMPLVIETAAPASP